MEINPIEIQGNWNRGFVLDKHVLSSVPTGEDVYGHIQYDTKRTRLGELVYQLKYRGRPECAEEILELIKPFFDDFSELKDINVIIPVPPSKDRSIQPVEEIGRAVAKYLGKSFNNEVLVKVIDAQSKDMEKSSKNLEGSIEMKIKAKATANILLIDDLFATGKTISECVSVLRSDPMVKKIYVLVMTKTK